MRCAAALGRRALLLGSAALAAAPARADEPPVLWYDANPQEQADAMVRAFHARHPAIPVRTQRFVGGSDIATRILQETQAGVATADIATTGADQVWQLAARNLLRRGDWAALGVPAGLAGSPFAVAFAASVHLILYNTRLVPAAAAPSGWDDLADPRWDGRIGLLAVPTAFAHLAEVWGEERAERYVAAVARLRPVLFRSSFPMAQALGAGEIAVASVTFQGAQASVKAGAPVALVVPDPVPVNTVYAAMPRGGRSPAGAQILLSWLASAEGALATEAATNRGIHRVHPTRAAALIQGRTVAEFPPEETATYARILTHLTGLLRAGGRDGGG